MTSYPRVAFVSSPDPGATVRLNLNDPIGAAGCTVNADGFSLGAPTLDGDPLAVGQVWGTRTATITPRLTGAKADVLAALTALAREQLRAENWLLFQLTASTDPVWFRILPSQPQPLSLDEVYTDGRLPDAWTTTLTLVADAFAYGARETVSTITFGSSLSATHPLQALLPALKGDAPTGLRVKITPTTGSASGLRLMAIASDATITCPVIDIGVSDGLTAGSGTASGTSNSAYLGGSYRAVTVGSVTPPTSNQLQRLSGTLTAPPAGRYRVFLHCQADAVDSTTTNQYVFTFGQRRGIDDVYGLPVAIDTPDYNAGVGSTSPFDGWVDLGAFTFPAATFTPRDLSLTQPNATWSLLVGTPTGAAGTVRLDAIKLVPIDGPDIRSARIIQTRPVNNTYTLLSPGLAGTWDRDDETFWGTSSGALYGNFPPLQHAGDYLVADPGAAANMLLVLPDGGGMSDSTGVWSADVSYSPRYLNLSDA